MSDELEISREAGARRYIELHPIPSALMFSHEGRVRYVERHPDFPFVQVEVGQRVSGLPSPVDRSGLSTHEEAKGCDWLGAARDDDLLVHTLSQGSGYAMTLLSFDLEAHESDDED